METPPPEPVRRSTRNALIEIPARMGALALTAFDGTPVHTPLNNNHDNVLGGLMVETNVPGSYVTPKPSPDELVIQARGRRKTPVTWSPDIDSRPIHPSKDCTPVKHQRSNIVLRSTPTRKRLLLNDSFDLSPSPKKGDPRLMSPYKKCKLEAPLLNLYGPLDSAMKALSSDQLISIIQTMICKHPFLEQELKNSLPSPDLKPLEERLQDLKRNIFKSLPNSRLTSKTDSPAYNRAATHVSAFKKCVQEQGRVLVISQQWDAVCDYVLLAWKYISSTPVWDNPPHNTPRKQCFKFLAAQCMVALKKVHWTPDQCKQYYMKLEPFAHDSEDIQSCLKQLETMKMKLINI